VIILLAFGMAAVPAGEAARPTVVLTAAPVEARAGAPFNVAVAVRGSTARVTIVASSAHGAVTAIARRSGRTHQARVRVPLPGDWRLAARLARRSYALTTMDVRSAGADLVEPFRAALEREGSLVIANGRGHDVLRLVDGRLVRIAGNGRDGFEEDGVPATSTAVGFPIDAAVGPDGDVYVVSAHRVRRIDAASGTISTIAGTGVDGYAGDGGPATAALLDGPVAVAVDAHADLFIAEAAGRIRYVDGAMGVISTYAGIGRQQSSGDGGPATAAGIDRPHGIAVGPDGDLYVADTYGGRVRRIDWTTRTITSVASGLSLPVHVAVAPDGTVFFAEAPANAVSRFGPGGGVVTRVLGTGRAGSTGDGGPAVRAQVNEPTGVAVAADGTIYVAEVDGRRIRRIDPSGRVTTIAR
jgi:sugar lactone lactonase YvrE